MTSITYWKRFARLAVVLLVALILLASSALLPGDNIERVRAYTRDIEFDYTGWTLQAVKVKLIQSALGTGNYLSPEARHQLVLDYLDLIARMYQAERELYTIYADPNIADPQAASVDLRRELSDLYAQKGRIGPVAESILQSQIAYIVGQIGLSLGGQPLPPVLYHSTALPWALIVSPRNVIRQDNNISLVPDLGLDKHSELEHKVDQALNVSSLVVPIGGVGVYPTMVEETYDLDWLSEVVSHEWVHNFLSLRPLGINYLTSPELRTMNETAASIAGKEIGRAVLEEFYPELVPPPPPPTSPAEAGSLPTPKPPAFDFNKEMHKTRITVDQLLSEGKVEEAETYMEQRRRTFWENGYRLRKLNQAYFAFYGAYADSPVGAAGEDPVGAAVRALRARSPSLAAFLNRISWMSSFEQLKKSMQN